MTIRVVLVDDQELVRAGLRMVLESRDIEVVGEAADGREALGVVRRVRPDVVLMDIQMPVMNGVAATGELCSGDAPPKVLVLTTFDLDEYVFHALKNGASGYLLKDGTADELAASIRHVAAGDAVVAPSTTRRLIEHFTRRGVTFSPPPDLSDLTSREVQVLRLVATGLSNAEIAEHLAIAEITVKVHVSRVLAKLKVRDRTQAVIVAYETGLVGG
ncbi:response regulator transcription factor [Tsukamurella serpentis]